MICPDDTPHKPLLKKGGVELMDDYSYFYLGYAVRNIEELQAFSDAYMARVAAKLPFDTDLDTPRGKLYRLREGVERLLITDLNNPSVAAIMQSSIPVIIEDRHHDPDGGNVLYMDGHVEFFRYRSDGMFPMNKAAMDILKSLSELKGAI
jgi:prepilin-type processing-associated H-X9-DG protein